MESEGITRDEAVAQLAQLRADREGLAQRMRPRWWYDAALGVVVFLGVGAISVRDAGWWQPALDVVALVVLCVAVRAYRRSTGFWVNGLRPGRTRRAITVWLVAYAAVLGLSLAADFGLGWRWATAVGGAVLGVSVPLLSRWWTSLYVAELREER
jgi:hypothetical protein